MANTPELPGTRWCAGGGGDMIGCVPAGSRKGGRRATAEVAVATETFALIHKKCYLAMAAATRALQARLRDATPGRAVLLLRARFGTRLMRRVERSLYGMGVLLSLACATPRQSLSGPLRDWLRARVRDAARDPAYTALDRACFRFSYLGALGMCSRQAHAAVKKKVTIWSHCQLLRLLHAAQPAMLWGHGQTAMVEKRVKAVYANTNFAYAVAVVAQDAVWRRPADHHAVISQADLYLQFVFLGTDQPVPLDDLLATGERHYNACMHALEHPATRQRTVESRRQLLHVYLCALAAQARWEGNSPH